MFALHLPANRWQAFLIHLGFSAVIFLVLLYLIVFVWYPQPYFAADGGWQGIQIIAGVDLVLGPLLTLIVYQRHKRNLKLDLGIIALIQVTALAWGSWLVYEQRTTMVTFADGVFYTLNSERVDMAGDKAKTLYGQAKQHPVYAFVRLPEDPEERSKFKIAALLQAVPLYGLGDLYEPMDSSTLPLIYRESFDMKRAAKEIPDVETRLNRFLASNGGNADDYAFFKLECRYQRRVLVLSRKQGTVAGALDIDPDTLVSYRPAMPGTSKQ